MEACISLIPDLLRVLRALAWETSSLDSDIKAVEIKFSSHELLTRSVKAGSDATATLVLGGHVRSAARMGRNPSCGNRGARLLGIGGNSGR